MLVLVTDITFFYQLETRDSKETYRHVTSGSDNVRYRHADPTSVVVNVQNYLCIFGSSYLKGSD